MRKNTGYENELGSLVDAMIKSVREEMKDEIERLEEENRELAKYRDDYEKYKRRIEQFAAEKNKIEADAIRDARRERLAELFSGYKFILWKIDSDFETRPKCNICDEKGRVYALFPDGVEREAPCKCRQRKIVYHPVECFAKEFCLYHNEKLMIWYKEQENRNGFAGGSVVLREQIVEGEMDYEKLNWAQSYFYTREEAQKYSDWLNAETEKNEKENE